MFFKTIYSFLNNSFLFDAVNHICVHLTIESIQNTLLKTVDIIQIKPKNFTKMKSLKNIHKTLFAVALMCFTVGFTACSDDDDDDLPPETEILMGMPGTYKGEAVNIEREGEDSSTTDFTLTVSKDKKMKFENFPVDKIINKLYADNKEEAEAILAEIGSQEFICDFESKEIVEKEGTLTFDIDTEDLEFTLENGNIIKIDFTDNDELALYSKKESTGKITFKWGFDAKVITKEKEETGSSTTKTSTGLLQFNFEKITK